MPVKKTSVKHNTKVEIRTEAEAEAEAEARLLLAVEQGWRRC